MTTETQTPPEIGKTVQVDGMAINCHVAGPQDAPPVLLIHGSGPGVTAWANWRTTLPALATRWRVVAPDMAGFGYTETAPDVKPDRALWLRQLTGLMDELGIARASVIGNSFGGALALALANRHPERVQALVLMGAVGTSFPLTPGLDKVWGYEPSTSAMRELLQIFVHDVSRITDDLVDMRYRASIRPTVQERFSTLFPAPRQRWVDALALAESELAAIAHPTLIVHGRDDKVIPAEASERLGHLLPNARLEQIDACGHWVQIEQTERFLALVQDFLVAQDCVKEGT